MTRMKKKKKIESSNALILLTRILTKVRVTKTWNTRKRDHASCVERTITQNWVFKYSNVNETTKEKHMMWMPSTMIVDHGPLRCTKVTMAHWNW